MGIVRISDLVDPDDPHGRTFREVNAAKQHDIPVGALVELPSGARLFVVFHTRDCDQTPLYYLSVDKEDTAQDDPRFRNRSWVGGYSVEYGGLRVVRLP